MKNITIAVFMLGLAPSAAGQAALALADCYARAEANYPLIRQRGLIEKTKTYSIENASKAYLPQISLGGQATYQSEVTEIPVEMPGVVPLSKDQYRVFGEISQTLYHGGLVRHQKQVEEINAVVEEQKLEVELYQIKNRINELFFGVLLLQEQIAQTALVKQDLHAGLKRTQSAIDHGTAIRSAADVLKAEMLKADQRILEMESAENSYRQILGLFINQTIDDDAEFEKPSFGNALPTLNRPELKLFEFQKQNLQSTRSQLSARKKPRLELFIQGGYGRPGLNMLENEFNLYYLGGVRFSWLLSGYYTFKRENQILDLRSQSLDVQKETFLFNTGLQLNQHEAEIAKLRRLVEVDNEIISLRSQVRQTASVQLEEGVITSTDFIREVNAEDQAKQNRVLHETQLLLAQAKYHFTSGHL